MIFIIPKCSTDPCIQNHFQAVWNMSKSSNNSMWMFPTLHCIATNKRRHSALWFYESQIVQKTLNYKIGRYVFMIQTYFCSPLNLFRKLLSLLKGVFTKPFWKLIRAQTPVDWIKNSKFLFIYTFLFGKLCKVQTRLDYLRFYEGEFVEAKKS